MRGSSRSDRTHLTAKINNEVSFDDLTRDMKYYKYDREAYGAVTDGFMGEFTKNGERRYGLKVYSPIGGGYGYSHFDDLREHSAATATSGKPYAGTTSIGQRGHAGSRRRGR